MRNFTENSPRTFISTKRSSNRSLMFRARRSRTKLLDSQPESIRKSNTNQSREFPLNSRRPKERRDSMPFQRKPALTSRRNKLFHFSSSDTSKVRRSTKTFFHSLKRRNSRMTTERRMSRRERRNQLKTKRLDKNFEKLIFYFGFIILMILVILMFLG